MEHAIGAETPTETPKGMGKFQRFVKAAANLLLTETERSRRLTLTSDLFKLDIVGILGVTPAAYGLESTRTESPAWHRTDLAVYLLRYQNGWGKAEAEDGRWRLRTVRSHSKTEEESSALEAA